jgi:aminoglycoside phosphotransferase (APT) family kinase protein
VPVPTPLAFCEDPSVLGAPFYVMEKLRGRTLTDRAATCELTPSQRAGLAGSMVSLLADLHEIDPAEVGLEDWGRPEGFLSRQLVRWRKQWDAAHIHDRVEIDALFTRLERALPTGRHDGIVHGDFKVDNMMVDLEDPTKIVGVLDWEMSTLGDTLTDLGLLVTFWDEPGAVFNPLTNGVTALEGFPSRREVIESYVDRRGIDATDIDWYVTFADVKIAIILEQIHVRHLSGHTVGTGFDDIGDMVQPLLDRAIATTQTSSIAALRL